MKARVHNVKDCAISFLRDKYTAIRSVTARYNSNKRGLSTVEMVALTVVVVGAVMASATVLNELVPNLMTNLFTTITKTLGLGE